MGHRSIEGTWEDVARRAGELAGHRVRITVLDDPAIPAEPGIPDYLLDHDAVAFCEREADDSITLDEVRAATSTIRDSMARAVIDEERAERF